MSRLLHCLLIQLPRNHDAFTGKPRGLSGSAQSSAVKRRNRQVKRSFYQTGVFEGKEQTLWFRAPGQARPALGGRPLLGRGRHGGSPWPPPANVAGLRCHQTPFSLISHGSGVMGSVPITLTLPTMSIKKEHNSHDLLILHTSAETWKDG